MRGSVGIFRFLGARFFFFSCQFLRFQGIRSTAVLCVVVFFTLETEASSVKAGTTFSVEYFIHSNRQKIRIRAQYTFCINLLSSSRVAFFFFPLSTYSSL